MSEMVEKMLTPGLSLVGHVRERVSQESEWSHVNDGYIVKFDVYSLLLNFAS